MTARLQQITVHGQAAPTRSSAESQKSSIDIAQTSNDSKGALRINGEIIPGGGQFSWARRCSVRALLMEPVICQAEEIGFWAKGDGDTYARRQTAARSGERHASARFVTKGVEAMRSIRNIQTDGGLAISLRRVSPPECSIRNRRRGNQIADTERTLAAESCRVAGLWNVDRSSATPPALPSLRPGS